MIYNEGITSVGDGILDVPRAVVGKYPIFVRETLVYGSSGKPTPT